MDTSKTYIKMKDTSGLWHIIPESVKDFDSMEQLWLAFYMYEKHSMVWDGEKWVKGA